MPANAVCNGADGAVAEGGDEDDEDEDDEDEDCVDPGAGAGEGCGGEETDTVGATS